MISQLQIEKRNLESSILFMQQDHSTTLKGLHEEISTLQKKCTELNFKLTMMPDNLMSSDDHLKQIAELEGDLNTERDRRKKLERELSTRDATITSLNELNTSQEKQYVNEMNKKNHQIITLRAELDSKSHNVAYLTTEMHKLKVMQAKSEKETRPKGSPPSREASAKKKLKAADIASRPVRPVTAKGASSIIDAEVFLAKVPVSEPEPADVKIKPTPPILPPISGREGPRGSITRRHMLRRRPDATTSEVTTLAVDSVASNSSTRINETNTTSD